MSQVLKAMKPTDEGIALIKWDNIIGPFIKIKYPDIELNSNEILNYYISHVMAEDPIEFLTTEQGNKIINSLFNKNKNEVLVLILNSFKNFDHIKESIYKKILQLFKIENLTIDNLKDTFMTIKDEIIESFIIYENTSKSSYNFVNLEIEKIKEELFNLNKKYNDLSEKIDNNFKILNNLTIMMNYFRKKLDEKNNIIESITQ
ncbi:MAG: hypothetical protein ACTSPY_14455 [Candidatus Helarchaeota archaeon]